MKKKNMSNQTMMKQTGKKGIGPASQVPGTRCRDKRQAVNMTERDRLHGTDKRDHAVDQEIPVSRRRDKRHGKQNGDFQNKFKLLP